MQEAERRARELGRGAVHEQLAVALQLWRADDDPVRAAEPA
jgi:hypothetical protein